MKCQYCGSEIEDTDKGCPICCDTNLTEEETVKGKVEKENEKTNEEGLENDESSNKKEKWIAECMEGHKTEIDKDDKEFYCEECEENYIIRDDGICKKYPKNQATDVKDDLNSDEKTNITNERAILSEKQKNEELISLIWKNNKNEVIKIPKKGGTIGRDGDYGSSLFNRYYMNTISRQHIKIEFKGGDWVISHLSKVNDTEINGKKLEHDSFLILKNNDEITLAKKISFRVEIK